MAGEDFNIKPIYKYHFRMFREAMRPPRITSVTITKCRNRIGKYWRPLSGLRIYKLGEEQVD